MTDKKANSDVGRPFRLVAGRDHAGDKRLHRLRQGVWPRRTSAPPRRTPPCWPTPASSPRPTPRRSSRASTQIAAEIDARQLRVLARARRHAHERREPAEGAHRHAGRPPAHRALAQRPGRDRLPPVRARRASTRSTTGCAACSARSSRKAEAHAATVMPGFTHLQPAQPVTFGHHLLAYVEMFGRDRGRFADARARLNECPLGSAALAGTSFPIDRHTTAEALGFDRPTGQFARRRLRPRLRAGDAGRRHDLRRAPVAAGRGDRASG